MVVEGLYGLCGFSCDGFFQHLPVEKHIVCNYEASLSQSRQYQFVIIDVPGFVSINENEIPGKWECRDNGSSFPRMLNDLVPEGGRRKILAGSVNLLFPQFNGMQLSVGAKALSQA